jgi:hypothetical protein
LCDLDIDWVCLQKEIREEDEATRRLAKGMAFVGDVPGDNYPERSLALPRLKCSQVSTRCLI